MNIADVKIGATVVRSHGDRWCIGRHGTVVDVCANTSRVRVAWYLPTGKQMPRTWVKADVITELA